MSDHLEDESRKHFDELQRLLSEAGVAFNVAPSLVRGLDYYTDTVFEVISEDLGPDLSLGGGGRYDHLVQELGGPSTPSVGVGIGIERLMTTMVMRDLEPPRPNLSAFLIVAHEEAHTPVRLLALELRAQGIAVQLDLDQRSVKAQFKQADRSGAPYAVVIGNDELALGTVTIKDLRTAEQTTVQRSELVDRLLGGK